MQKEFHDQIAIVCKLPFKPADTFNPVGIYILGNGSVQTFLRNLIHPCRIQKYKLSGFRNFGKMPVQKRFSLVILRLFLHRYHHKETRINILDDLADCITFSGRSPAFKHNKNRYFLLFDQKLLPCQFLFYRFQPCLNFLLRWFF